MTTATPKEREFEDFFDEVWERCLRTATRMGLRIDEAQDVALDALAIAYDRWARIGHLRYREAWVLKVATNLGLRAMKKRDRRLPDGPPTLHLFEDQLADRVALENALIGLPRRQREVVFLRYLADLSESDTAAALGIDVGSVKKHASRGRAALKQALSVPVQGGSRVD